MPTLPAPAGGVSGLGELLAFPGRRYRLRSYQERGRLRDEIRERIRSITGLTPVVELVPPRTLPRTSSGKLSRTKARNLYLSGEIVPFDIAA